MRIRLKENFRAIFYAPYYAAHALGFFAREGVEVELIDSNAPGDAIAGLIDGSVDLTWGGPMRVMTAHDRDPKSPLVCFGEVVARDPFFLIGKRKPFRLADLAHLRFASVAEVPTPWMCLQHDLREAGIAPDSLKRISNRSMTDNFAALGQGALDVMQGFEPFASMAERDGTGDVLYHASARGPTVYTAFIATRGGVAKHHDAFTAMTRAIAAMELWLYNRGAGELAEAVAPYFPDVPKDLLARSLQRYRDAGLWAHDPAMSRQGFDRLGQSFLSGGSLARPPVYENCVEQRLLSPGQGNSLQ
jgi:NitT/TauT family transport system substrate-binding protein